MRENRRLARAERRSDELSPHLLLAYNRLLGHPARRCRGLGAACVWLRVGVAGTCGCALRSKPRQPTHSCPYSDVGGRTTDTSIQRTAEGYRGDRATEPAQEAHRTLVGVGAGTLRQSRFEATAHTRQVQHVQTILPVIEHTPIHTG